VEAAAGVGDMRVVGHGWQGEEAIGTLLWSLADDAHDLGFDLGTGPGDGHVVRQLVSHVNGAGEEAGAGDNAERQAAEIREGSDGTDAFTPMDMAVTFGSSGKMSKLASKTALGIHGLVDEPHNDIRGPGCASSASLRASDRRLPARG